MNATQRSEREFRRAVLSAFSAWTKREGLKWCVLHQHDQLDGSWETDIDLCVDPEVIQRGAELAEHFWALGFTPVLGYLTGVDNLILTLARTSGADLFTAKLDLTVDVCFGGVWTVLSGQDVLMDSVPDGEFPLSSPLHRYAYSLTKRLYKGGASEAQRARLARMRVELGPRAKAVSAFYLGDRLGAAVDRAVEAPKGNTFSAVAGSGYRAMKVRCALRSPVGVAHNAAAEGRRLFQRLRHPAGISFAVLGPDGSGKSTLLDGLADALSASFHAYRRGHTRPGLLPPLSSLTRRQHGEAIGDDGGRRANASPAGASIAKVLYYGADYWLGHVLRLYPTVVRAGVVVFDRYHPDWVVDPLRWRLSLHPRLLAWAQRVLPSLDYWIVLDQPPELTQSRRQEVSPAETRRQRQAYLDFSRRDSRCRAARGLGQSLEIDASGGAKEVLQRTLEALVTEQGLRVMGQLRQLDLDSMRSAGAAR
ncbi:MAG: hypothetical protein KC561_07690 [Myxococcales bacterium]|nr:hypothetical protein [Myxococcales bacterium]